MLFLASLIVASLLGVPPCCVGKPRQNLGYAYVFRLASRKNSGVIFSQILSCQTIKFNAAFGLILILVFGLLRFIAVLYGIQSGNNQYLSLVFVLMILSPVIFLSREGRRFIGWRKMGQNRWMLYALLLGSLACLLVYGLGQFLYGNETSNWFRYIGASYPIDLGALSAADKRIYFIVFLLIGMTFSPFGEELLYRGVVHGSLLTPLGERKAALLDSAAFGLTHLAHFGIIFQEGSWRFLPVPAAIWVLLMTFTGLLFNFCKSKSSSILGAIVAHIGFNATMTWLIFYRLF